MKSSIRRTLNLAMAIAAVGVASLISAGPAQALTYTWSKSATVAGTSASWSTDGSWSATPVSAADTTLVFGYSSFGPNSIAVTNTSTNDIADPFLLNVLTFGGATPTAAFTTLVAQINISGTPLKFVSNGATTPQVNLSQNNSNAQIVSFNVQSNVTLDADTLFTGNGTGTFTFSGQISGAGKLTKSGTSTLTLSNANNDFTGGVTLSAGGLVLGSATALGSNTVSVTGNSTISATSGTVGNSISITNGVTLSLRNIGATNSTTTFSSAITGAVGITLVQGAASGTTIALSNANNTFTGNVTLPTGTGANDFISFASIGDSGSIIFGRSSWRSAATYTGSANLNLGTRSISLATTFGGSTGLDGGGNPINMFANNGTGTVTITPAMGMTSVASSGYFFFGGTNTGSNTFAGAIADPSGANVLGIGKWDAGRWILTNSANSFEGIVWLTNGTLSVNAIDVAGNAQPLGKASLVLLGQQGTSGTLEYIGSASGTTNKQFQLGNTTANQVGAGSIINNGTGSLTFSNATFNPTITGITATRTLTLGGSNAGNNEIQGIIQNNAVSGLVALTKTGIGKWILSGANTMTGATSLNGGGTLVLDYSIQNNSKIGAGILTLGGGTLDLKDGSFAQTVVSTSLSAAGTFITRSAGSSTLNLNAITLTRTGALNLSANGIATTDNTNSSSILGGWATVGSDWAVNSTGFADAPINALSSYTGALPSSGAGAAASNYTLTGSQTQTSAPALNTLRIAPTADSLTLALGANNLPLNSPGVGNAAGLIYTGIGSGSDNFTYTISGTGNIRPSAANQDLFMHVNDGTLNVTALLGQGSGSVVKSGNGTLIAGGNNSYSGSTLVYQGTLRLTNATGAGSTGAITVQNLATLELANSVAIGNKSLTITGTGVSNAGALRNVASNSSSYAGAITIGNGGARINSDTSGVLTLTGGVTTSLFNNVTFGGSGNTSVSTAAISGAGGLVKDGAGTTTLGFANTYSGATIISGGTLQLGVANVLPNASAISIASGTLSTGAGTGFDDTVGALTVSGSGSTIALGTGVHTLTFASVAALNSLTITGWQGTLGGSGSEGRIVFTDATGFNPTILSNISFTGFGSGATLIAGNELVPVPEPTTIGLFAVATLGVGGFLRRRLSSRA